MMTPVETQPLARATPSIGGPTVQTIAPGAAAPSAGGSVVQASAPDFVYGGANYNASADQTVTMDRKSAPSYGSGHAGLALQVPPPAFEEASKYPERPGIPVTQDTLQPPPYDSLREPVVLQPTTSASVVQHPGYQMQFNPALATVAGPDAQQAATALQWMPKPAVASGCPPGLEYLTQLNQLTFVQQPYILAVNAYPITRFSLLNTQGQQVYFIEQSVERNGGHGEFKIRLKDCFGQDAISMTHTAAMCCASCYCSICCQECSVDIFVESPPGQVVGAVRQQPHPSMPTYNAFNSEGAPFARIEGADNFCGCGPRGYQPEFSIKSLDRAYVLGKASLLSAMMDEAGMHQLTNCDIVFPMDLDVKAKATLIGAALLLHRYYFVASASGESSGSSFHQSSQSRSQGQGGYQSHLGHHGTHGLHGHDHRSGLVGLQGQYGLRSRPGIYGHHGISSHHGHRTHTHHSRSTSHGHSMSHSHSTSTSHHGRRH